MIVLCGLLGGCTITGGAPAPSARAAGEKAARWEMPPEFRPSTAPGAAREKSVVTFVPKLGYVRGTRETVQALNRPLAQRGRVSGRAFRVCRGLIETAAKSYGADRVEAVSAGPQRPRRGGGVEAPMEFRILYASGSGYEVRQATIACQLDASYTPVATPIISA